MTSQKRPLIILALVAAAIGVGWYRSTVYSDTDNKPRPKLVVLTGGSSPYWQLIANGAKESADVNGAELDLVVLEQDEDVDGQNRLLSKLQSSKADGIALSPLDANQQTRFINELAEASVVVTVDSDAPLSNRLCYVGASNFAAGSLCADLVKEAIPDGGKVVVLVANLTKHNVLGRKQALEEKLAGGESEEEGSASAYDVVAVLADEGNLERCRQQLTEAIQAEPEVACVVGLNSYHAEQIVAVLEEQDALDKMKVVSFDTEDATLKAIEAGHVFATVAQDPYHYGYEAVRWLADNSQRTGNQLPLMGTRSSVHISTRPLRAEDVPQFREKYRELLEGKPTPADQ